MSAVEYHKLPERMTTGPERVSLPWWVVLKDMDAQHVDIHVNEGHRTLERQAELVREKGLWSLSNQTGAAAPSANAPHIRTGRIDHALDLGSDTRTAIRALYARGIHAQAPIVREPWHIEANPDDLRRYYNRFTNYYEPKKAPGDVVRVVKAHLRRHGYKGLKMDGKQGLVYRMALGRFRHKHGLGRSSTLTPLTWEYLRNA